MFSSELVRAERDASVSSLIETRVPAISPQTELPEVARLMADFDLLAIPVIDEEEKPIGVVAFDDVLALLIPEQWRRRAGDARRMTAPIRRRTSSTTSARGPTGAHRVTTSVLIQTGGQR